AGLLARNAQNKGLQVKPWVKTSLAPGSKVVTRYLENAKVMDDLEALGFHTVGYGCTTCIGNSGPLPEAIEKTVTENDLIGCSVLSGNRNFEGRIHALVQMNFLASPPLVVAYALAGTLDFDFENEALGKDSEGNDIFLRDIWPTAHEVQEAITQTVDAKLFTKSYSDVFAGDKHWQSMPSPTGTQFAWADDSTYVRNPPYFDSMGRDASVTEDIQHARCLALLGDSVTTDHISPAGAIAKDSPAADYLRDNGIAAKDFNTYGSRRGNHEVMMRGTFANIRLRNQLAPGTEGSWTKDFLNDEIVSIFEAAQRYKAAAVPTIVIAGAEYGTGSSRDWAAKGPQLLGVRAAIAKSFERIHRSNLIGMGILPLQFKDGEDAKTLGLSGSERFTITGISSLKPGAEVTVQAADESGTTRVFQVLSRIDTPKELDYFKNGGILQYVLRQLTPPRKAA
ncbi:MAG: aconitate hydratase AcnA, partial [Gammaproteobacteria bacterium]|nr:aconitate hydratase AcnA [Gammaproteobacteria bacterium]